jgi:hypothetical protein
VKLSRTRWRDLLLVALLAGGLSFAVFSVVAARGTLPSVPWLAPITLAIVGIVLLVTARVLRPRLQREPGTQPVPPLVAGRLVALSFAASRAGAAFAGVYGGLLVASLLVSEPLASSLGRERVLSSAVGVLAAGIVTAGGWALERALLIRQDGPDGGRRDDGPGNAAAA